MKTRRKEAEGGTPDVKRGRREMDSMKPTHTIEVPLEKYLGGEAKSPRRREEAAQKVAEAVERVMSANASRIARVSSIGEGGRVWSMNSASGRATVSFRNGEGERVKIEFFRFDSSSKVPQEVREALKEFF